MATKHGRFCSPSLLYNYLNYPIKNLSFMFSLDISIAVFVYPSVSSSIFRIGFGKIILVTNLRSNWKDNIHHWTIEWRIRPYVWNDSESSWPQFLPESLQPITTSDVHPKHCLIDINCWVNAREKTQKLEYGPICCSHIIHGWLRYFNISFSSTETPLLVVKAQFFKLNQLGLLFLLLFSVPLPDDDNHSSETLRVL